MSRYGNKTYTRRPDCKNSIKFDQLLSENKNKPSTAKVSVASVHRWGMATFTSIRKSQLNGRRGDGSVADEEDVNNVKRMKMNSKLDPLGDPFSFDSDKTDGTSVKPVFVAPSCTVSKASSVGGVGGGGPTPKSPLSSKPNKFFKSGGLRAPLAQQNASRIKANNSSSSPLVPSSKLGGAVAKKQQLSMDSFKATSLKSKHEISTLDKDIPIPYPKVSNTTKDLFDMLLIQDVVVAATATTTTTIAPISSHSSSSTSSSLISVEKSTVQNYQTKLPDYGFSSQHSSSDNNSYFLTSETDCDDVVDRSSTMNYQMPNELASVADSEHFFIPKIPEKQRDENIFSVENIMKMQSSPPLTSSNLFNEQCDETSVPYRTYGRNRNVVVKLAPQPMETNSFVNDYKAQSTNINLSNSSVDLDSSPSFKSVVESNSSSAFFTPILTPQSHHIDNHQLQLNDSQLSTNSMIIQDQFPSQNSDIQLSQQDSDYPLSQVSSIPGTSDSSCFAGSESNFNDLSSQENICIKDDFHKVLNTLQKTEKDNKLRSRKIFNTPKKLRAVYKVRAWHEEDKEESGIGSQESESFSLADEFEDDEPIADEKFTLSKRVNKTHHPGESITSWKCEREVKQLYTVVHNVKQAHQCHESGETQEFNDDVEYLLEGVQVTSSLGTRCLSTLGWASKCMVPAFRIHLRAHGTIPRVFSALMDSPANPSLSLCTATLMFVLSQDRLTMDLEASTLSLMLQLLECNVGSDIPVERSTQASQTISPHQADKIKEKVRSLCEQMQLKGYAKQLDLNNITGGILAMETLLSLSSRRTGEWFKEEIRILGGLDYIVDTVKLDADNWCQEITVEEVNGTALDRLRKIDRCLRVIENVTYMDVSNQTHLIQYKEAILVTSCLSLLKICRKCISFHPIEKDVDTKLKKHKDSPGAVLFACILTLLKVLFNLSHENLMGSLSVGSHEGVLESLLLLLMQTPVYVPIEERFDLLVLSLAVLINLVEHCQDNRGKIVVVRTVGSFDSENSGEDISGIEALVEVFLNRLELAKQSEEQADALLDSQSSSQANDASQRAPGGGETASQSQSQQSQADQIEETLMKALQKAGKHMEHSIIAAYIALLLGCVIQNPDYANVIRVFMPNENFESLMEILRKFLNFVNLTGVVSTAGMISVKKVLAILEAS